MGARVEIVCDCAEVPIVAKVDAEDHNLELCRVFGGDNGTIVAFDYQFQLESVMKLKLRLGAGSDAATCSYLERLCFAISCLAISPEAKFFDVKATEECFLEV